jgi:arginase
MTIAKQHAQSSPTAIIGAAFCRGARDPRCDFGPQHIRRALEPQLARQRISCEWQTTLRVDGHGMTGDDVFAAAATFCTDLAQQVAGVVAHGQRFAVIGGDHSCAIGTWSGAALARRANGPIGLVWIDAHMDSHTPETSHSGALHGMPLACLLGRGEPRLTQIAYDAPKLLAAHTCVVGVRSYEPEEAALLEELGVRVIAKSDLKSRTLDAAIREAVAVAAAAPGGFGVTIDLDVIDPVDAPGVGSPEPGGVPARQLLEALASVRRHPALLGVEIAEYNPFRDRGDKTADLVIHLLSTLL